MIYNGILKAWILPIFVVTLLIFSYRQVVAAPLENVENCVNAAAERTKVIKALPTKTHIQTLDGKIVSLRQFFAHCHAMFPWCGMFEKFYYWEHEIREVISDTLNGRVKHRIRCYFNCLSTICPQMCDPLKTHGDIAEFYDTEGNFMGMAVYVGNGNYCPLPYSDYQQ
jgi:hypothetical protein